MLSPMEAIAALSVSPSQPGCHGSDMPLNLEDLFQKLSELLDRGLATTAAKITGDIKADFQNLGSRMEAIEHKLDTTVARANQYMDLIHVLQNQLDIVLSRIDDLENSHMLGSTVSSDPLLKFQI